jgi:hypothetical protein
VWRETMKVKLPTGHVAIIKAEIAAFDGIVTILEVEDIWFPGKPPFNKRKKDRLKTRLKGKKYKKGFKIDDTRILNDYFED